MSSLVTMARALLYLRVTSLVGLIKARLERLKQPKYLAGALVGVAYVYFIFIRRAQAPHRWRGPGATGGKPATEIPAEAFSLFAELGALLLLLVLVVNWVIPRRASLIFSEAEIAFLFPAPVNRRMLIHYRLLGSQLGIVFTALILTVALGRAPGFGGGNVWFHAIGWWLVLATLNLHFTGTSFVYSKLLNRSMTSGRRKAITMGVALLVTVALIVWIWSAIHLPQQSDTASPKAFVSYLATQLHVSPLSWLLAIPALLVAPYFASTASEFLLSIGPALAVLITHYFWVISTEVSFEEASIARAEKRAARVRAVQQGDWRGEAATRKARRPPFNLDRVGRPEVAFLWKNLLSTSAFFRPRVAIVVVVIIIGGSQWLVRQPGLEPIRFLVVLMFGVLLALGLLLGPMIVRQDLRADLPNSDILKTYPLRGWQIVLGELLTPLSILTVLIWVCLFAVFLLLPADRLTWLTPTLRGGAALGLAVLVPPFVAIQLLVPNAAAVIFPAWTQSAGNRAERGIEVMGQRIIFMAGQLLVTAVATVPAAIAAAVVFFAGQWLIGPLVAAVLGVAAMFILFAVEVWAGVRWLGRRFEHFDLSAELRP
ncbi:MAG: putative ABC exporter domain-containing protein [Gammaproteobacteria bacterium]